MVQKLIKDFIIDSHRRRSPRPPPKELPDLASEENTMEVEDRPSYIDIERHASQTPKTDDKSTETNTLSKRLVDVSRRSFY